IVIFTANVIGGTSAYTYNFQIINTVTPTTVLGNYLAINSFTGNTFSWTIPSADAGNTVEANIIITDSATTNEITNSIYSGTLTIISGYTPPTTPTLTLSNTLIDQGQSILFTANTIPGLGLSPYSYAYNVYAYNVLNSANALIANMLFTANTYTSNSWFWTPNANLYAGNTMFYANVAITDAHPTTVNSVANYFGYNSLLIAAVPTESNALIDLGQVSLLTAQPSGGTLSYSYNWYANYGSSVTCSGTGNQISGATSSTYLASTTTTNSYAYRVTDSASVHVSACSLGNTITVNAILNQPTISTSNALMDQNQYAVIASYETGGTLPYTYNFLVFNAVSNTIVANMITTSNSFAFQSNSYWNSNSPLRANVFVLDGATTNTFANSVNSGNLIVNSILITPTISSSNTVLAEGQYTVIASYEIGGTPPYTYNFLVFNAVSNVIVANMITTTNTFTLQSNSLWTSNSPLEANVLVMDSATTSTSVNSVNSGEIIVSTISSTSTLSTSTISNGGGGGGGGGGLPCNPYPACESSQSTTISTSSTTSTTSTTSTSTILNRTVTPLATSFTLNVSNGTLSVKNNTSGKLDTNFSLLKDISRLPSPPSGYSILYSINISSKFTTPSTVSITTNYQCGISSNLVEPFLLQNNSWYEINPYSINSNSCTETFNAPGISTIAMFVGSGAAKVTIITVSTTIPTTTIPSESLSIPIQYEEIAAAVLIIAVIITLAYYLAIIKRK
ncbi:MAG: hypothetical protein ABR981_03705, partial [Candidatus Micrarchaeaceae archaeon]